MDAETGEEMVQINEERCENANRAASPMLVPHVVQSRSRCKSPRRFLNHLSTAILCVLLCVFILLYALAPRVSVGRSETHSAGLQAVQEQQSLMCTNAACVSASALLQTSVDLSARPCQDFFSFACGGFQKNNPFSAETVNTVINRHSQIETNLNGNVFELLYDKNLAKSKDPELNEMFQAARFLYMSCLNWYNPLSDWSSRLELLPNSWVAPGKSLDIRTLIRPLLTYIEGFTDVEDFVARLVITGTSGLLELQSDPKILVAMRQKKVSVLPFVPLDFLSLGSQKIEQISATVGLSLTGPANRLVSVQGEIILRQLLLGKRDVTLALSAEELDHVTSETLHLIGFKWTKFFERLNQLSNYKVKPTTKILITRYIALIGLLQKLVPEVRARRGSFYDFIRYQAVLSVMRLVSSGLGSSSSGSLASVSSTCMKKTMAAMPTVLVEMFRSAYTNESFDRVKSLIEDINNAMKVNVNGETWISPESKRNISQQLNALHQIVFYPKFEKNHLTTAYGNLSRRIIKSTNYGEVFLAFKGAVFRNQIWLLTTERHLSEAIAVFFDLQSANALYFNDLNSIFIQPGILHTFMYNKDYPDYLLYGGIGSVIGHEIGHALNFVRRQQNPNDTLTQPRIIDTATEQEFLNRTFCLIDSYGLIGKSHSGSVLNISGSNSVSENFADVVGVNAAFRAYRASVSRSGREPQRLPSQMLSTLTPDQLFFVQDAQFHCSKSNERSAFMAFFQGNHSPPRSRVNGKAMHSRDFARVFNCRPGDAMYLNSDKKCHFW